MILALAEAEKNIKSAAAPPDEITRVNQIPSAIRQREFLFLYKKVQIILFVNSVQ